MWIERAGRRRLSMEVLVHQLFHTTHKGGTTRQQFVDHDCQRILVTGGYRHAAPLFGSHGGGSATNGATGTGSRGTAASNTEVSEQQSWAVRVLCISAQKKVRRFDVQVNNLMVVGILKGVCGLLNCMCE